MSYLENIPPESSSNHPTREDLVLYMSNVPSYLEKGENRKEKALNVGVLDFCRLEKWQSNHKSISQQSSRCSPSTSNSSVFSTDESSTRFSRAHSSSPARPRMHRRSLESHLNESPKKAFTQGVKTAITEHVGKYEDCKASLNNPLKGQPNIFRMYQSFSRNQTGIKLKEYTDKDTELKIITNFEALQDLRCNGMASRSKGKEKIQNGEPTSGLEECQEPCSGVRHIYHERCETVVLPRNDAESSNSAESRLNVSEGCFSKHGSDKPVASSCLEGSGNSKSYGKGRSQSSPLKRLLDTLLKPKASNSHKFVGPSGEDASLLERDYKSSTVHPAKVKLDFSSCKTASVDDSLGSKNQGSPIVQGLLQIVIKNGIPVFTFAVDNSRDILAAKMRKDEKCWVFTFFTVHELKKKNRWINQTNKVKIRAYIPNAIAQMTVSDFQFSNFARHNSGHGHSIREFVLFGVDLKQVDPHSSNLQTNDELSAIVFEFQKEASGCLGNDGNQSDPDAILIVENDSVVQSHDLLCATVILPSGVHGLPSKGPSPLIKRWKSGGLCDCGGWDMGCRLRVLANQAKLGGRSSSAKTRVAADRFELFTQGEVLDDFPVFSMSSFKDGIFSVEFNSSLAKLQAFSICIAVLSCRKPYEYSELSKVFERKS